ncbi:hypothetical protein [Armatimonas sp.]|uniref:hypothetical protein n=1 Tax=Armatimonas sp. TaxID=1872638 RepID=UPI00286CCFE4|nr:hypothetical protein [Armatimonas sp.]
MRLVKLTEAEDIANAFEKMSSTIIQQGVARDITIGYQGGNETVTAYWHPQLNFWSRLDSAVNPDKIFCTFGTGEALVGQTHAITIETNLFKEGGSWAIGGAFAKDLVTGKVHLVHTGKISGSKGINMNNFLDRIPNGKRWTIHRIKKEIIKIGSIEDDDFVPCLHDFILDVEKFKKEMTGK